MLLSYSLLHRNKSGIWGWRSEKSEAVSGYEAKVSPETLLDFKNASHKKIEFVGI
jgi:hypothetical protein